MNPTSAIANRIREVLLNGHWIANTNYKEQLADVNWKQATQKLPGLNTIAALTFHINYYLQGLLQVFNGGELTISDQFSFQLPPIVNETAWDKLVSEFLSNAEEFASQVEKLPAGMLDKTFADEKYGTYQRNIEGVIEHSYYHLGQISLMKKMLGLQ